MNRAVEILLVEDSPSDVLMVREAMKQARLANRISVVDDGEEALDYLRRKVPHDEAPAPDLILLDLNLPRRDGREVLAEIKKDDSLKSIPVVVLTTSSNPDDVARAYALHANCYIVKPVDFSAFRRIIATIEEFWFQVVSLPHG